jgi:N-acetylmuramoyl-L-alanine amidase
MPKHIFISPENRGAPHGPYAGHPGVYEREVCLRIARYTAEALHRRGFRVTLPSPHSGMAARVNWANRNGVDYYLCIHTNAGGGTGAECLYYNHPASIKANRLVYDRLTRLYPSQRGLKDYSHFYENARTRMVSCYAELAFHDNPKDTAFILSHERPLAEALCQGVCAYFGLDPAEG